MNISTKTKAATAFKILVDQTPFDWQSQFITGADIRELGNIPVAYSVFLKVNGPGEDELISDDTQVDLSPPGREHFYSKLEQVKVVIIVNGREHSWTEKRITFEDVIVLAFGKYVDKPTIAYTVAYEDGPPQNPEGSMVKGSVVFVKDKMIFHATATDKS